MRDFVWLRPGSLKPLHKIHDLGLTFDVHFGRGQPCRRRWIGNRNPRDPWANLEKSQKTLGASPAYTSIQCLTEPGSKRRTIVGGPIIGVPGTGGDPGPDAIQAKTKNPDTAAIIGTNEATLAFGSVGGRDPVFHHQAGVFGSSNQRGVMGYSYAESGSGVFGASHDGIGVLGQSTNGEAGHFEGRVKVNGDLDVTGDIRVTGDVMLSGGDVAEQFDVMESTEVEPGTVMILGGAGRVRVSREAYDKRVAGVISGAGPYRPGVILDHGNAYRHGQPLALMGKVLCKVDASHGAIEVGDPLTTSPRPGHAMKVLDPTRAFGAVLGKAMAPLAQGQDLLPVLITLQ
jgi:hypothetical protein